MTEKKPLGIYIHIPFCKKKCAYCDFASFPTDSNETAGYLRVLGQEIRSFEALGSLYRVRTVFFGGGTPSLLAPSQLERILQQLRAQFEWEENVEISMESNPGTLTAEKLNACRRMGINRLSIGLQSVFNDDLERLGRIHRYAEFEESYRLAREAGFGNINVDLMSGLPYQTPARWEETLRTVAALAPEHLSAYSLSIEEGTAFHELYSSPAGQMMLPDEETDREMYHRTREILEEYGYHRYEFSNYAKEGFECRHNLAYWTGGEYVGFGLSAASYLDRRRFANSRDKAEYWKNARYSYNNYKNTPMQTLKEQMEEYMFLGLRTARGVSREGFAERFHMPFPGVYEKKMLDLYRQGFIGKEGDRFFLTDEGIDVSNPILAEFLLD